MKIYTFGAEDAPVLLLLPGTCCHWKSNFGAVIPLLADSFRVLCVSYDGFDETEQTEFSTMLEETKKIEAYLKNHCGGHIRAAYGCSLGGSFVGLLAARQNIHMDYGILGSSDLDQASPLVASLQTNLLLPLIYPVVRDGKFKAKFLQKQLEKHAKESGDYVKAFLKMFGDARPYVTMQSCKNQFYSDLITPLPDKIHVPGTQIHIFYALKMGKKYRARYQQHFVHPVLHEQNLQHEELLACHPEQWAHLVKSIALFKQLPNAVLFAAGPCWEGVDFPGDRVSLLIIARLPFPVPDPVSDAEKAKYPDLHSYIQAEVIPTMQKKLRQGFGRAIRTETDTCTVAILDPRAAPGGRYHRAALDALPKMNMTQDIKDVEHFIRAVKGAEYFFD